jgi:NADPH:quinone reductase-like Zn-dependent oxidoreductase
MQTEAMVMRSTGGPEVLERAPLDLGELGPREVRVAVRAVAMNHLDLWTRRGLPNVRYEFPHRLGADVCGVVEALGPGARGAKVGDEVLVSPGLSCGTCERCLRGEDNFCKSYGIIGENRQGGYARHVHVPDTNLLPKPKNLSFVEAAAIPLVFLTAWQMVVRRGQIRAGQTVLVQAAGSGVSSAAIQIAKMHGARVFATTSKESKAARARELGAEVVINYATQDFVTEVKRLTEKRGVDLVIEHLGGEIFVKSVLATAWGGRVVTCGATTGYTPQLDLRQIFFRQVQVLGSTMGSKGDLFEVLRHVEAGTLRPVIAKVFSLWDATEAHRFLEGGQAFGKVVLEVD